MRHKENIFDLWNQQNPPSEKTIERMPEEVVPEDLPEEREITPEKPVNAEPEPAPGEVREEVQQNAEHIPVQPVSDQ